MRRRNALAGLAGAVAVAGAGALAQKRLLTSIAADPESERLNRPLEGERIPVRADDGTELHVEAFGPADAPKLVLVHGWMCAIEFWRYQIDELAGDFRVIAYDQRGHGKSDQASDYSFEAIAADLGSVLAACLDDDERALIAGHSMGAMTIAAWAGDYPDEVERHLSGAILFNTGLGDLITESVVLRTPERLTGLRDPLGRLMLSASLPVPSTASPFGDAAVKYVAMSPDAGPARVAFVRNMVLTCNPKTRGAFGGAMSRMDLWDSIKSLTAPTIVVVGELDKMTPLPHSERMAESLPNLVELVEVPTAGHMTPIEAPERSNEIIRALGERPMSPSGQVPPRPRSRRAGPEGDVGRSPDPATAS